MLLHNAHPSSWQGPTRRRVEDLLSHSSELSNVRLDGFAAFLAAPTVHRVATLFLDYLGRLPDEAAMVTYVDHLNRSHWFFTIRSSLTQSQEFLERKIKITDRVGSLITSTFWNKLRTYEPLGERRRDIPRIELASYSGLSDLEFAKVLHEDVHGDSSDEGAAIRLGEYAGVHGRRAVASLLLRDAVAGQRFLELIGD